MAETRETRELKPFDASTVILTRERENNGYEIFLMRRHGNMSFMGNAHVFPGGKLDPGDCDPELVRMIRGLNPDQARALLREPELPDETARGLYLAAVRETFEEAGVLLAGTESAGILDFSDPEVKSRFNVHRKKIHDREIALKDLTVRESLIFPLEILRPHAHWITPDIRKKRFDTRFFLAKLPSGQTPVHDSIEMTESLWISPKKALEQNRNGQLFLMPPTLVILEEMAEIDRLEDLFSPAAPRDIPVILPQVRVNGDEVGMILPFDPEYSLEEYKQENRTDKPSRLILTQKGWRTVSRE